ncbi:hypothetical protein QE364_003905 [Nocardioides zeae]|uniref:Uncharacterized protein n=1 Tax=Nocardioides zeae TaxID=1457234 RepID=A0ACC6IN92_9ACTN|nr:hypothetical protein [Nocardioides zeae]MDR6212174.1 hypothetical protein [Nocardioides zeae]
MPTLSPTQVYQLARGAGLAHDQAVIATAIAHAESGLRSDARGDTGITTGTWGPSIGLWQVRSLKAESGTGRSRDATRLTDPAFNARSMVAISSRGTNWRPWSVYTSGAYRAHLATAQAAASGASTTSPTITRGVASAIPDVPGPVDDWLEDKAGGLADDVMGSVLTAVVMAAAVGLGVTLVAIGAWRVAR